MTPMHITRRGVLLLLLVACLSGGRQLSFGQNFQNLATPPPSNVYHPFTLPNSGRARLAPVPPQAHALAVRVLENGRVIQGSDTADGTITTINRNLLSLHPAKRPDISIGFALPPKTLRLKTRAPVTGELQVTDNSSPFAVDQEILITEGTNLFVWYAWQSRRDPIIFSLPDSVGELQQHRDGNTVKLTTGGTTIVVGSGETKTFTARGIPYAIFVQTTALQPGGWKREGDGTQKNYVLKAIVAMNQ
jgi:hypothetical protein